MSEDGSPAAPPASDVWIVIPACNEAERIGRTLDELLPDWPNVVVVDDGSRDRTAAVVLARPTWLLRHAVNLGQGAALQTGLRFALDRGAGFVVTYDADGQHRPEDIEPLLAPLRAGQCDFALGSRFLGRAPGMPWTRKLLLKLAIVFTRVLSGVRLSDAHNGLRAMTRRGAASLRITLNRMEHASQIVEQIHASGLPMVEVPVTIRYTAESLAKGQHSADALRLAGKLLIEKVTL